MRLNIVFFFLVLFCFCFFSIQSKIWEKGDVCGFATWHYSVWCNKAFIFILNFHMSEESIEESKMSSAIVREVQTAADYQVIKKGN